MEFTILFFVLLFIICPAWAGEWFAGAKAAYEIAIVKERQDAQDKLQRKAAKKAAAQ